MASLNGIHPTPPPATDSIAAVREAMRDYPAPIGSPPMRIMAALLQLAEALEAGQRDLTQRLEALPLGDVEATLLRAARKAIQEALPEAKRTNLWQRRSAAASAAVVAFSAVVAVGLWLWRDAQPWHDADLAAQCALHQFATPNGGVACSMTTWIKAPVSK